MADNDLQVRLQQAKRAMAGDHEDPSRLLATELVKRRINTLKFAGDTPTTSGSLSVEELTKRREQARRAMESFEQKKRRELKQQQETEAKIMAQKIEAMKQAREKLEQDRAKADYQEKQQIKNSAEQAVKDYNRNVAIAKAEIEAITQNSIDEVSTYRTLKTDFGQEVHTKGLSMTKIALEEEARRRLTSLPREAPNSKKSWLIGGLSILLIIISAGALYGTIQLNNPQTTAVTPLAINSIAFADDHIELPTSGITSEVLINNIKQRLTVPTTGEIIINLYPTTKVTVDNIPTTRLLSAQETLTTFGITTPISFYHFLQPQIMFGLASNQTGTSSAPFFIFKTRSFENTFDALLRDEKIIIANILRPFVTKEVASAITANSFKDKLINNIDTRIATLNTSTTSVAVYGFIDRETLVVTTTESAFLTILRAYQTPRPTVQ